MTLSPTPKAQKTTAVPTLGRAGGEDGCEEVLSSAEGINNNRFISLRDAQSLS